MLTYVNVAPRYLYNLSQPWITHYSIQHVHNRPADLWRIFGRKPFVWDEVKCLLRSSTSPFNLPLILMRYAK